MKTSMIKRFVSVFLSLLMVFATTSVFAEGDSYSIRDERYPDRHWAYMTNEEIASYEAMGWTRSVGVLWYDTSDYSYADFSEIPEDPQELINEGYVFHVIYSWICPGEKLGKHMEQSVSAGYWQLNVNEIKAFYSDGYETPQLVINPAKKTGVLYESNWAIDGEYAIDPDDTMSQDELDKYEFVRVAYDDYNLGYGEEIVLLNGDIQEYSLAEAVEAGGFDGEMIRWN